MEPVSGVDRLMLLLRQKLAERAKANAGSAGAKSKAGGARPVELSGLAAVAAVEGDDERPLRRAFIQHLLADQLGAELVNDAQFQQIVSRVTEAIEEDPEAARLLTRLITELRAP